MHKVATARDALSNDGRESAACFERPAKQALALATELASSEARGEVFSFNIIPVSSTVATSSRARTSPLHTYT